MEKENEKYEDNGDDVGEQPGEVIFAVEKGSPADKVLQVLKHHQFDAEVTGVEVKGGGPGRHQLVKVEGVLCDGRGSSPGAWHAFLGDHLLWFYISWTPRLMRALSPDSQSQTVRDLFHHGSSPGDRHTCRCEVHDK